MTAFNDMQITMETKMVLNQNLNTIVVSILLLALMIILYFMSFFLGLCVLFNLAFGALAGQTIYSSFGITYFSSVHVFSFVVYATFGLLFNFIWYEFWMRSFQIKKIKDMPIERLTVTLRQSNSLYLSIMLSSFGVFLTLTMSSIMPLGAVGWSCIFGIFVIYS